MTILKWQYFTFTRSNKFVRVILWVTLCEVSEYSVLWRVWAPRITLAPHRPRPGTRRLDTERGVLSSTGSVQVGTLRCQKSLKWASWTPWWTTPASSPTSSSSTTMCSLISGTLGNLHPEWFLQRRVVICQWIVNFWLYPACFVQRMSFQSEPVVKYLLILDEAISAVKFRDKTLSWSWGAILT